VKHDESQDKRTDDGCHERAEVLPLRVTLPASSHPNGEPGGFLRTHETRGVSEPTHGFQKRSPAKAKATKGQS